MPPEIPDLPDDYELGETQANYTSTIMAGIILLVVLVATVFLIWSIHP
jgi:hypothetical protein